MVEKAKKWYNFQMDSYQKFISQKAKKKRDLLGAMFFPRTPVFFLDISKAKKPAFYKDLLKGLDAINLTTLVLLPKDGEGEKNSFKHIKYINHPEKNDAFEAADFALVMDGDVGMAWGKGCVPISMQDGSQTTNYNPLQEKGNGFYFARPTKWEVFAAIVRALETYQFPYDWENLIKEILRSRN